MSKAFRFLDTAVEPEFIQDMKSLNSLGQEEISQLTGLVLEFMASADAAVLIDGTQKFIEEHGVNQAALKSTLRSLLLFFKGCARKQLSCTFVHDDLTNFGLNEEKAAAVAQLWRGHFVALSRNMVDNSLVVNKVVDMNWRFGVTAASSELAQVGTTFLQLKLEIDKGENRTEFTTMELTLPQFYDFIQEMEKAKAAMDFLAN